MTETYQMLVHTLSQHVHKMFTRPVSANRRVSARIRNSFAAVSVLEHTSFAHRSLGKPTDGAQDLLSNSEPKNRAYCTTHYNTIECSVISPLKIHILSLSPVPGTTGPMEWQGMARMRTRRCLHRSPVHASCTVLGSSTVLGSYRGKDQLALSIALFDQDMMGTEFDLLNPRFVTMKGVLSAT